MLNDAPFVIEAAKTGGQLWEPKNYDAKYEGPMRLRTALAKSKNMVSIRLLQAIGPGLRAGLHPALRLRSRRCTRPTSRWRWARGRPRRCRWPSAYAIFANGGYRVKPWFISRVEDNRGQTLYTAKPETAGEDAERVLDERNAFLMTTLMRDVVRYGTAARAMSLGRQDLAGKTGTTNDHIDAWFAGFMGELVAVSWIGFDTPANLGPNETGGQAALPIWMAYAAKVLKGVPETEIAAARGRGRGQHQPGDGLARAERGEQDDASTSTRSPAAAGRRRPVRARRDASAGGSEEPDFLGERTACRNRARDATATCAATSPTSPHA